MGAREEVVIDINADSNDAAKDLERVAKALKDIERQGNKAGDALDTKLRKGGGAMAALAGATAAATDQIMRAGAAILRFGAEQIAEAVKAGAELNFQLDRVVALSGMMPGQFEMFRTAAVEASRNSAFSANDAARALGFLAQAGFGANEQVSALPGVLQLAAAAQVDLARTADIASNILTGFGKKATEIENVNNVLAGTFTRTNVNLSQLGEALKLVAPLAAGAGQSFEQVTAAVGLLGNAGIQGTLAGTALRRVIVNLQKPSEEAATTLRQLGVSVEDASGQLLSLDNILQQLADAGATAKQLTAIFGVCASPAISSLLEQGPEKLRDFTEELKNVDGLVAKIEQQQLDNLLGQFQIFTGNVDTLRANLEAAAEGGLKNMIVVFNELMQSGLPLQQTIDKLTGFFEENEQALIKIAKVAGPVFIGVLDAILTTTIALVENGMAVIGWLNGLRQAMVGAVGESHQLRENIDFLISAVEVLALAITSMLSVVFPPLLLALPAIAEGFDGAREGAYNMAKELSRLDEAKAIENQVEATGDWLALLKDVETALVTVGGSFVNKFTKEIPAELKRQEEARKRVAEQKAREDRVDRLRLKRARATGELQRALLDKEVAIAKAIADGSSQREISIIRAEKDTRLAQIRARLAEKERKEKEALIRLREREQKAFEKEIAQRDKLTQQRVKEGLDRMKRSEAAARELVIMREQNKVSKVMMQRAATVAQIKQNEELTAAEKALEIEKARIEAVAELGRIEEERRRKLDEEISKYDDMAEAFSNMALEGDAAKFNGLIQQLGTVADLTQTIRRANAGLAEGYQVTAQAAALSAGVVGGLADATIKSEREAAKVKAAVNAAASLATFAAYAASGFTAAPLLQASLTHAAAAVQFGVVAGTSSGAKTPAGGGGSGRSAGGGGPGARDIETIIEMNAKAIADALGDGGGRNVTVIVDQRGAFLAGSSPEFDRAVASATRSGLRLEGVDLDAMTIRQR